MLRVKEAVVVEGRYDKNALSQVVDAVIVETAGFGIFRDSERMAFLRRLAEKQGLIVLTDSDGAGFLIRNYIKGAINPQWVKHAYIPDRYGKERRKRSASREGKLGVEAMSPMVLLDALRDAGATFYDTAEEDTPARRRITKADLFAAGLSGGDGAAQKRLALLKRLDLPEHLSANALVDVLNTLYCYEELEKMGVFSPNTIQ